MSSKKEICELMDKLLIKSLELMEQEVKCKMNIEKLANDGKLDMAQTRYSNGTHSVSSVQLPTEDYKEFNALSQVKEILDDEKVQTLQLIQKAVDKNEGYIDPLNWFGILIPMSLQNARDKFTRALEYVVECANVQMELQKTLVVFNKFQKMKNKIDNGAEY